ncbi:DUF934 domain-containing protein [Hydrogenophaga pseudoflava]|uniref:DUF934 domain-containing protein n=1 Tax=Hydrogenophaga pseudoflava TaxID=47421 RepID=UPI0027E4E2B4|nr:DUF934 domain-containing protein [Hydrogenophaga pseudoflava]MDQ7744422.1 DUF934 domain-containing protein [Hydrogenophaga pseudoflava]
MKSTIQLFKADSFSADEAGTLTLPNDADPREASLDGVHTVQLQFPSFADGRAFSQAFLLRRRLGFTGQIRAVGDVLIDQLAQMQRSGFTQAVLRADQSIEHGQKLLAQYDAYYQGDAVDTRPHFAAA